MIGLLTIVMVISIPTICHGASNTSSSLLEESEKVLYPVASSLLHAQHVITNGNISSDCKKSLEELMESISYHKKWAMEGKRKL